MDEVSLQSKQPGGEDARITARKRRIEKIKNKIRVKLMEISKSKTEIERINVDLSESKSDLAALDSTLNELLFKNPRLAILSERTTLQILQERANDLNLLSHHHFSGGVSTEHRLNVLTGEGGNYIKSETGIICYLSLLKQKYGNKIFNEDIKLLSPDNVVPIEAGMFNRDGLDYYQLKINYNNANNSSYIISFNDENKQKTYTFGKLRNDACKMWNIPESQREKFHIMNEQKEIYSSIALVWEVHMDLLFLSNWKRIFEYFELVDVTTIRENKEEEKRDDSPIDSDKKKEDEVTYITNKEFTSSIEEYSLFYRKIEGIIQTFKKDQELEKMKRNHLQNLEKIKKRQEENLYNTNVEQYEKEILNEKEEIEKYKDMVFEHSHKREPPIYVSPLNVLLLRQLGFLNFVFHLLLAFSFFCNVDNIFLFTPSQIIQTKTILSNALFFNPMLKHFFANEEAYDAKDLNKLINTKKDLLIWFKIVLNNMFFPSPLRDNKTEFDLDYYNNFLFLNTSVYELLLGSRIIFKFANQIDQENGLLFNISKELPEDLKMKSPFFSEHTEFNEAIVLEDLDEINDVISSNTKNQCSMEYQYFNFTKTNKIYFKYNNEIDQIKLTSTKLYEYEKNGFMLALSDNMTKLEMSAIIQLMKDKILFSKALRAIIINMNIINPFSENLIKTDVLFEISPFGSIFAKITYIFIDILEYDKASGIAFKKFVYVLIALYFLKVIFNIICYLCKSKTLKFPIMELVLDIVLFCLIILVLVSKTNFEKDIADFRTKYEIENMEDAKNKTGNFTNRYFYDDCIDFAESLEQIRKIGSICVILLFLKLALSLTVMCLVQFMIKVIVDFIKNAMNFALFIFTLLIWFTLFVHYRFGTTNEYLSYFSNCFLVNLIALVGVVDTSFYGDITITDKALLLLFLFVLKFVSMAFLLSLIKTTYDSAKKSLSEYRKSKIYQVNKELPYDFLKNALIPISTYFTIKEIMRLRKIFKDADFAKIVEKKDRNIVFIKFDIDDRDIFYFYERKQS